MEKQPEDIEITVNTDLEATNAFLRGIYSKLSRPGPSSSCG